ncbi:MAG: alpha/beta hydrolase [Opitutus sp.]|nr:alpha/beta hydrolase [Opitutus sp.]
MGFTRDMNLFPCRLLLVAALFASTLIANAQQADGRGKLPPPPAVPAGVKAYRNVPYVDGGHERQVLDLFVPDGGARPLPVIIWIHGGGWTNGDKNGCPPLRQGFAQNGYAIASFNYRLSQHAIFPAQIEDCKAAIRWLRAHAKEYNLNADRFAVWGSSAGGHLVAFLGTSGDVKEFDVGANLGLSSRVQCVMDDFGPTDFVQMDAHRFSSANMVHGSPQSPESKLIGADITAKSSASLVARVNPITYVTRDDAPFLINHGDQDPLVPHHQSELLFDALKASGVRVRLNTVKGGGHGAGFGGSELEKIRRDFLEFHLKGVVNDAAKWAVAMQSSTDAVTLPVGGKAGAKKTK